MRKEYWEKILNDYLFEMQSKPFGWGSCDCLIFVSDYCRMITEKDPMGYSKKGDPEDFRELYDDEETAYELIREHRRSMPAIMDRHFNRVNAKFAQRGDVILQKLESKTFGIINNGLAWFKTPDALVTEKPNGIVWRVE